MERSPRPNTQTTVALHLLMNFVSSPKLRRSLCRDLGIRLPSGRDSLKLGVSLPPPGSVEWQVLQNVAAFLIGVFSSLAAAYIHEWLPHKRKVELEDVLEETYVRTVKGNTVRYRKQLMTLRRSLINRSDFEAHRCLEDVILYERALARLDDRMEVVASIQQSVLKHKRSKTERIVPCHKKGQA
jgi:hypothetical protein